MLSNLFTKPVKVKIPEVELTCITCTHNFGIPFGKKINPICPECQITIHIFTNLMVEKAMQIAKEKKNGIL